MHHHVAQRDEGDKRKGDTLPAQRRRADLDDGGVVAKLCDKLRRGDISRSRQQNQRDTGGLDAKPKGFDDTVIFFRAEIEPADRLKPLPIADHGRAEEVHHAVDDGHARHRRVAVDAGHAVEANARDAGKALTEKRR